jgi:hypothetical protein
MHAGQRFLMCAAAFIGLLLWGEAPALACQTTELDLKGGYTARAETCDTGDLRNMTVTVLDPAKRTLDIITRDDLEATPGGIEAMDLTGSVPNDIYIPMDLGNANTSYNLYAFDPKARRYKLVMEDGGLELMRTDEGLIFNANRGSCCSWSYGFYRWNPTSVSLDKVGTITVAIKDEQPTPPPTDGGQSAWCDVDFPEAERALAMTLIKDHCPLYSEDYDLRWKRDRQEVRP